MAPSPLRRLALVGMVALLVGAAPLAQTTESAQDDSIEAIRTRANAGDADAQNTLGGMYADGRGVPEGFGEALLWWRKAVEQGHADAQFNLGAMYRTGKGVPEDFGEAAAWFRKAAEQGHAGASFALGFMYVSGSGVPQDDIEGYKWFSLTVTYANGPLRGISAEARDDTAERLTPEQLAEGQKLAREWFEAHPPE